MGFDLIALAVGTICVFILTLGFNVPIHKANDSERVRSTANVMEIWKLWERVHTVRMMISIAVFALEVLALCFA